MARALLIVGFLALAIGLLWIGQGTGAVTLAAVELHDQPAAMGGLRRGARRRRPDPDLARQALIVQALNQ